MLFNGGKENHGVNWAKKGGEPQYQIVSYLKKKKEKLLYSPSFLAGHKSSFVNL